MTNPFIFAFLAIAFTALTTYTLRHKAHLIAYVDQPDERKLHQGIVPKIGGVAMASVFLVLLTVSEKDQWHIIAYPCLSLTLIVAISILDDLYTFGPLKQFLVQILAVSVVAFTQTLEIQNLGALFGTNVVMLHLPWSIIFTVIAIVGTMNAINMIDGIDGLAGSLSLIFFIFFGLLGAWFDHPLVLTISVLGSAVVIGFLLFNFPGAPFHARKRTFMGGAGSSFLGFILAWLAIELANHTPSITMLPMSLVWIIALPLVDMSAVMLTRILKSKHTGLSDNLHIHFVLKHLGYEDVKVIQVLGLVSIAFGLFAVASLYFGIKESDLFYAFISLNILFFWVTLRFRK
jgi:UDP-GlcNAc:undecaprenyl-phosphate GlcNAc-1-phosphate transferase